MDKESTEVKVKSVLYERKMREEVSRDDVKVDGFFVGKC